MLDNKFLKQVAQLNAFLSVMFEQIQDHKNFHFSNLSHQDPINLRLGSLRLWYPNKRKLNLLLVQKQLMYFEQL